MTEQSSGISEYAQPVRIKIGGNGEPPSVQSPVVETGFSTVTQTVSEQPKKPVQVEKHQNYRLVDASALSRISTKLARETEFNGDYRTTKPNVGLSVAGSVSATFILSEGSVFFLEQEGVAKNSKIEASVVLLEGEFSGEIKADKLEIMPGAIVEGKLCYKELSIHRGASINAEHSMD